MATSTHISNFGSLLDRNSVILDLDGFIHLTTDAVRSGNWGGESIDAEDAADIAAQNSEALDRIDWQPELEAYEGSSGWFLEDPRGGVWIPLVECNTEEEVHTLYADSPENGVWHW